MKTNDLLASVLLFLLPIISIFIGCKTKKSCKINYLLTEEGSEDIYACSLIFFGIGLMVVLIISIVFRWF